MTTLPPTVRQQMLEALITQNPYDLYDALADHDLETPEVWQNRSRTDWIIQHIRCLLRDDRSQVADHPGL